MSDIDILISDKKVNINGDEIIISKPKWCEVKEFIAIVEKYFDEFLKVANELEFTHFLLQEGRAIDDIEAVIKMCLRKNKFSSDSKDKKCPIQKFLAELDYDLVFNILFEIISMNADFFKQGMEKMGLKAKVVENEETPALTGES